jgi:hypothetical protein
MKKLVERHDIIIIELMNKTEALTLAKTKLEMLNNPNNTAKLIFLLEFMPLVIVQAAVYIC